MSADPTPLDSVALFRVLRGCAVAYVVIGGVAAQAHGLRRSTMDLDLIPDPDHQNLQRLHAALVELGARPREMPAGGPPSVEQLQTAAVVPPLVTIHGSVHILNIVPGAAAYEVLSRRVLKIELDGIPIAVAGLDDLVAMKRAAGRPQDLRDIAALTAT